MSLPALVGRTYRDGHPHIVTRAALRDFADSLQLSEQSLDNPRRSDSFRDRDTPTPPTYPIVLSLNATFEALKRGGVTLDEAPVLHREQEFTHHRPIRAGDALNTACTVIGVRSVAGYDLWSTRSEITDVRADPVCTVQITLAVRKGRST